MNNKRFKAVNRIAVFFTEKQVAFLKRTSDETGDSKSAIIRRGLSHYMDFLADEKIKDLNKKVKR